MSFWKKLKRWERKFERTSTGSQVKTMVFLFGISFLLGSAVSLTFIQTQTKKTEELYQDIKQAEKERMDKRIDQLESLRYEALSSN